MSFRRIFLYHLEERLDAGPALKGQERVKVSPLDCQLPAQTLPCSRPGTDTDSPSSLPLVPLPCPATGQMMLSWSYSKGRLPELTSTMWSVLSIRKIGFELFQCRLCTAAGLTWTTSKAMRPTVRRVEVQASTMTLIKAPPYYPSSAGTTTGPTPSSPHSSHPQTQL